MATSVNEQDELTSEVRLHCDLLTEPGQDGAFLSTRDYALYPAVPMILYGSLSQGLGTAKFTNLID